MPTNLFPLDNTKKFTDQKHVGHNRWHPDIPPAVSVKPGDVFRADCREWFDGAIKNDDSADDVRNAPLPGVHVLSGPFRVEGAEPGDLLVVDILEIDACDQEDEGPLSGMGWGYTGVFAKTNGGGFLTERFPDAYKVIWDFTGDVATSRHIPECSYVGIHHPGLMGTAPSAELLAKWTKRETDLIATDPDRVPPLALPPLPDSAILGTLEGDEFNRVAGEAARTAPPRENGGNQDIKNFTAGTRVFYPVFVDGANLSFGDLHFSQGDGEITFCGAIEMGGFMDLHVDVIKGGMETYGLYENAIFMPGLRDPQYSEWIAFSGVSVDLNGKQHYLNSQLSYERACHHAIDYLMKFGYSDIQAYMILGSAPIEGRFSGVVDIPNSCATVYIPRRIFDFDVAPGSGKPHQVDPGHGRCRGRRTKEELTVAIYEYRCERDGAFEVTLPIGTAPASIACPAVRERGGAGVLEPDGLVRAAGAGRGARPRGEDQDRAGRRDVAPAAAEARAHADGPAHPDAAEAAEALGSDDRRDPALGPLAGADVAVRLDVVELRAVGLVGHHRRVDAAVLGDELGAALGVGRLQLAAAFRVDRPRRDRQLLRGDRQALVGERQPARCACPRSR